MLCNSFNPADLGTDGPWLHGNRVVYSAIDQIHVEGFSTPTCSIKYTLRGTEHYTVNNKRFAVSEGNFLLVNEKQPADVVIQSSRKVVGFCLHLEARTLQQEYARLTTAPERILDDPFRLRSLPELEVMLYSDRESSLGTYLRYIVKNFSVDTGDISIDRDELYFNLAHRLVALQNTAPNGKVQLNVVRSSTRNELLRRLKLAKQLMDAKANESLDISSIAKEAMLSGSHFFRTFKKVYGLTPYQYLFRRRMERAAALIEAGKTTATDVAFECGFSDLPSFSKAFKKVYGLSPNKVRSMEDSLGFRV